MRKMWKRLMALLCVSVMVLSGFSALAAETPATDTHFDVSGSKTADPTELACPDRKTTVTLSLPSAEYKNIAAVVFVMDNSTSVLDKGFNFAQKAEDLLDGIVENNPGIELKVAVIKFRGYATDMLGTGLTEYTANSAAINAAINNIEVPGSGSNVHSGLRKAKELLDKDDAVKNENKFIILLTDGKSYIWNNEDDEPVLYYAQYFQNGTMQYDVKYPENL